MSKNSVVVPEARQALDKFKMETANEVGVNLKEGYNGNLTSREAGSVGGQMVNEICPVQTLTFKRQNRSVKGHLQKCTYDICINF